MSYKDKDWLNNEYWNEELSIRKISKKCNCHHETIRTWLIKFNIPRRTNSEALKGDKNPMANKKSHKWKGDKASKRSIHFYILKRKEKIFICEDCFKHKETELSFDHSLGDYTRDPIDYKWLCSKCHFKRDKRFHERDKENGRFSK